ncbi:unnamed protein product [Ectocarpus sp. CCAP 1310/34]|nr:unnamed protein product [Ectocarpus sp. CCAP 1310/34]
MEVDEDPADDHDEDWRNEDTDAASGGGQATLSFGSAGAGVSAAVARTAQSLCPEIAPRLRAAQPCRATIHRRKRAALDSAKPKMAGFMATWLGLGDVRQSQQSLPRSSETQGAEEELLGEQDSGSVLAAACSSAPHGDGDGEGEGEGERDSDSCSETDMLIEDGADLAVQYWVGECEQEEKQGDLGEHCDGYSSCGSRGFLDGTDYPAEWSDGSLDSGGENDVEVDGDVETRRIGGAAAMGAGCEESGADGAAAMGAGCEESGAGGAAANARSSSSGATSAAAEQPVRRSTRETSRKAYAPLKRASAQRVERGGPGRGNRVMMPGEVANRLERCSGKTHKGQRTLRRAGVKLVGQLWTKERRERRARRTRRNCTERQKKLIDTFCEGRDKIDKVGNDLASLVENEERMLTPERIACVCRVISVVRAYFDLEIRYGVQKMVHSRAVGEGAGVHAKTVRRWVTEFCKDGKFVVPDRAYVKRQPFTYIDDEDIRDQCREYIDERIYRRKGTRFRVADFHRWVNEVCLEEEFKDGGGISRSTAHHWISQLGFRWRRHGKCVYVDGHNRPDVVEARRLYTEKMFVMRRIISIPEKVETVVMVKVRDAEEGEESAMGDSDGSITGLAAGKEPVLWPVVRKMPDGRVDSKHVLVYGNQFTEATGDDDCTRVCIDEDQLKMRDRGGDYSLVPDREVQKCYEAKSVTEEVLLWPARRVVAGKEEYKHVRVHDGEQSCGDCKRLGVTNWLDPDCACYDCKRTPFVVSSRVPFNRRDLSASDGLGDFCLVPDHEVMSLYFHDETTAKENDDGGCQWMSIEKGAAIKKKGEGRAVHVSDIIGVDRGVAVIGKEAWGMMQEDMDVLEDVVDLVEVEPATEDGEAPKHGASTLYNGRSGIYFGRQEGDGVDGHAVKFVQDAVKLLKAMPDDCGVTKTENDPSTGAVIMTVGQNQDGFWNNERMCKQIPGLIAIHELTSEPHRPLVMVFDNSTGHAAYETSALVASHINKGPGGGQAILDDFLDDEGNLVRTTFRAGDKLLFKAQVYAAKTPEQLKAEEEELKRNPKYKKPRNGDNLGEFAAGTEIRASGRTSRLIGQAKGGQQMLMEMGLWDVPGEDPVRVLECKACKGERAATRAAITSFNRGGEGRQQALDDAARRDETDGESAGSPGEGAAGGAAGNHVGTRSRCCIGRVFAELKAFKMELNKIEKMFKKAGHICIFLAKYHPELNAIERYWGYVKHLLRLHCEYSLKHMLKILPGALSGVPLRFMRGWSRVTWLYLEAYDEGLVDYLEVRDLKKWLSHRSPTERGDSVVLARAGAGKSSEKKKKAEEKALAAAQELRTESIRRSKKVFKAWKVRRAYKKAWRRVEVKRGWNALVDNWSRKAAECA